MVIFARQLSFSCQEVVHDDKKNDLSLRLTFEDSCAVRDDLRKAYEKCNDISQESRALICTLLNESSEKDRKLHLSMYGKAAQLEKQMELVRGLGKRLQSTPKTYEDALKEMLEEEVMNKKVQEEKIRQEQAENDAFFLEFGVVRYDSECESSD
ncbi:hypothetical protein Tco_0975516 [Tanacetum coccineum]|uniref:Uncharacterized protein n=1 Tax=Tanacetum coccineum TaxID=301880 RepID=A0ABQ5EEL6_9ASTR